MAESIVTTIDNPWNPFTNYDQWLNWDNRFGWKTPQWVAFFSFTSSKEDEEEYERDIDDAFNRLVEFNPYGVHVKVYDYEIDDLIPIFNKAFEEHKDELATNLYSFD